MSQENVDTKLISARNGKIINADGMAKHSVGAIFQNKEAADAAVTKLTEAEFTDSDVKFSPSEMSDKGDYVVIVHAGGRADIALEILVNAGGDTKVNQPEQIAEQARDAPSVPDESIVSHSTFDI